MNWFICIDEEITGPFTTNKVLNLTSENEFNSEQTTVWGSQLDSWLKYDQWVNSHEDIINNRSNPKPKNLIWYFAENSQSEPVGPFNKQTLIEKIAEIENKDLVLIWSKGMEAWASLFEFNDILESLSISRRKHPRAPLTGQAILKDEEGQTYIGKVNIISPGGCGVTHISGLKMGDIYQIEIKSSAFYNTITAVGKILHESGKNSYGIRFEKIHIESQSTIISYLKEQGYMNKTVNAA